MDLAETLSIYPDLAELKESNMELSDIINDAKNYNNVEALKLIFSLIDLTTLDVTDTVFKVEDMCNKVNRFPDNFQGIPNVAAICVYPSLVNTVKNSLNDKDINIASVVGGFPASQTFIEIKALETAMAVKNGATEADMVISVGKMLSGELEEVSEEISVLKTSLGEAHLKVIIESGALSDEQIYKASLIAMEAGADFIKTSTGKYATAATPEAAYIMCLAIREFYNNTGIKVGFKPAGGISKTEDALIYFSIVGNVLGDDWLSNKYFRIGASRLANDLLKEISKLEDFRFNGKYF